MGLNFENYRDMLKHEFEKRVAKNPRYSIRGFARSIGLDPRHLDGILRGSKGLSLEKAKDVVNRLGCSTHSQVFFLESVKAEDGRKKIDRITAQKQLETLQGKGVLKKLEVELGQIELVSDWIGIAVHEYIKAHPETTFAKLVQVFQEPSDRIKSAIECLKSLNLVLKKNMKYTAHDVNIFSSDEIPSPAIRNGHRSVLKKAEQSLEQDSVEQRDFNSLILNIDPADLPAVKKMVRQFLNQFHNRFSKDQSQSEVMSLALQLIPLSKPISQTTLKKGESLK